MYNYIKSLFEEIPSSSNTGWPKVRGQNCINVISFNNCMENLFLDPSLLTFISSQEEIIG